MPEQQNEQTFSRLISEGFNRGNLAALDDLFAPTFLEHQDGFDPPNIEGVKRAIVGLRKGFPDISLTVEDLLSHGDKTWARIVARGTHEGQFMGRPPSGKSFTITVIDICRYQDGKIVEHWGVADRFSQMRQLGLLPTSPPEPTR